MYDEDYLIVGLFALFLGGLIFGLVMLAANADNYYVEEIPADEKGCVYVVDEKRSGFEVVQDDSAVFCPK
jgi:hypothetical protein